MIYYYGTCPTCYLRATVYKISTPCDAHSSDVWAGKDR